LTLLTFRFSFPAAYFEILIFPEKQIFTGKINYTPCLPAKQTAIQLIHNQLIPRKPIKL